MVGCSRGFLFGENLEASLSLLESDSFDESPESASVVTEKSCEMQTVEHEAHSCIEFTKTMLSSLLFSLSQSYNWPYPLMQSSLTFLPTLVPPI